MDILIFVLGIVFFILLIVLHELGHAIVAKKKGVVVEEFGIGFPPRALSKKLKDGMLLSLNWLPLGGFVKLKGEHDNAKGKGTYGGVSLWSKTQILLAGVAVNWLTAVLIFTVLAIFGLPKILPNQFSVPSDTHLVSSNVMIAQVNEGSPAAKAGIKAEDELVSIDSEEVRDASKVGEITKSKIGQTIDVVVNSQGQEKSIRVQLNSSEEAAKTGALGIYPAQEIYTRSTWSAPIVGVGVTTQFTVETVKGLAKIIVQLVSGKFVEAGQNVAGPVGIVGILKSSSEVGIGQVLFLIGIISLTLAVMNALPMPALDGGRLFVTVLFRALKKELTKEREEKIQAIGFIALMALVILITVVDVGRIFK